MENINLKISFWCYCLPSDGITTASPQHWQIRLRNQWAGFALILQDSTVILLVDIPLEGIENIQQQSD